MTEPPVIAVVGEPSAVVVRTGITPGPPGPQGPVGPQGPQGLIGPTGTPPQVSTYTVPGSYVWTKPAGCTHIRVILCAGGGGGTSGSRGASGVVRNGGRGGHSNQLVIEELMPDAVGDTVTVKVGTGQPGGAAITTDNTVGVDGGNPNYSVFGPLITSGASASTTSGGAGGVGAVGSRYNVSAAHQLTPYAGGGGGGINASNVPFNGADAYDRIETSAGSGAVRPGGVGGGFGGNGSTSTVVFPGTVLLPGTGGSGGGAGSGGAGGKGGDGTFGGGGGGGGASVNGYPSGAGGKGGDGFVQVIAYFIGSGPQGPQGNPGPQGPQGPSGGAQGPQGPQGVQGPSGVGMPAGGATGTVLTKRSGTDYDTQWAASGAGWSFNVKDYGAKGDGVTDDTAAINATVAVAPAGATVFFPQTNVFYRITSPILGKTGIVYSGGLGRVEIRQATQFQPAFDLYDVSNCTVTGFKLTNSSGPPPNAGPGSFRGDSGYAYSAGVWANGGHHSFSNLNIVDFAMGFYLNSSDGVTNVGNSVKRVGNTIKGIEISGVNHGVLWLNQDRLYISDVWVHDHVDSSAGANPTHALYGTGNSTNTSSNITIDGVQDINDTTGNGASLKYIHGMTINNLFTDNAFGLIGLTDCFDVIGQNLMAINDIGVVGNGASAIGVAKVTTQPARIYLDQVTLVKSVDSAGEAILICDDSKFTNFNFVTMKGGLNTSSTDISIRGSRVTVDGAKLRNIGPSSARAIGIGAPGYTTSDVTVSNFEVDNYRHLVQIDPSATGVNVIDYAPAAQRRIAFGTGNYVGPTTGTPPFIVTRRECTNTYTVSSVRELWPIAGLETCSRFVVTTAITHEVREPLIGYVPGMIHEIAIQNATGGAMGTLLWSTVYAFISGSPPANPANGVTKNLRFMYDGTKWREMG